MFNIVQFLKEHFSYFYTEAGELVIFAYHNGAPVLLWFGAG